MKKRSVIFIIIIVAFFTLASYFLYQSLSFKVSRTDAGPAVSPEKESFYSQLVNNIQAGGPPKDGIPAIDKPKYESVKDADKWLLPDDIVFGIQIDDFIAAYPQRILVWHEIANENINGQDIAITYCPLTGTAIGYKNNLGVSGKLTNSNLVMYDRESDSYWPQILGVAIMGSSRGRVLEDFPVVWTKWDRWKKKYPDTKVLSQNTGFLRDYGTEGDPYGSYLKEDKGYYDSDSVIFDLTNNDDRLPPKTVVVGIRGADGGAVAVLKDYLRRKKAVEISLDNKNIKITYDELLDSFTVSPKVAAFDAMWFAWSAFYPDTELIQ